MVKSACVTLYSVNMPIRPANGDVRFILLPDLRGFLSREAKCFFSCRNWGEASFSTVSQRKRSSLRHRVDAVSYIRPAQP